MIISNKQRKFKMLNFKKFAELFINNDNWDECMESSTWSDFEKVCELLQAFELYKVYDKGDFNHFCEYYWNELE